MRRRVATGTITNRAFLVLALFSLLAVGTARTSATVLRLSDFSSDVTPVEWLDATLDFSVVGNTLTLEVTNLTGPAGGNPEGSEFDISEIYFNIGDGITDLTFTDTHWDLTVSRDSLLADAFGLFDVLLDVSNLKKALGSGETKAFVIGIVGTGSEADFTSYFSEPHDDDILSLAAAKFIHGPDDDSAYGDVVPEPMTVGLLGLGGLFLLLRRRKSVRA